MREDGVLECLSTERKCVILFTLFALKNMTRKKL